MQGKELCDYLLKKLNEEAKELRSNLTIEEVVDVLEVLEAISKICLRVTMDEVMKIKEIKKQELGGFDEGLVATYYE